MLKNALFISFILFSSFSSFADEVDCAPSKYSLASALPRVELPEFGLLTSKLRTPDFCFDSQNEPQFKKEFEELKAKNIFDESNCSHLDKISAEDHLALIKFMLKVMEKSSLNIYSLSPNEKSTSRLPRESDTLDLDPLKEKVVLTNKALGNAFRDSDKLTQSDILVIGGVTTAATLLGTVASKNIYKGEGFADKRKHEIAGAAINFAGTGVGYLALETFGLGDKLRMSKHARKCAVTATGTLLLFAAAAGKEAYDKTKPKKHTVDAHDFVATVLGGGAGAPFVISCGFNF